MMRDLLLRPENEDKTAVIEGDRHTSFRELAQKAASIGRLLPPKRNIAIFLPNSGNYIAAFFGVIMAGQTAFPLSVQLTLHELVPLLAQADVPAIVTSHAYRGLMDGVAKALPVRVIYVEELPEPEPGPLPEAPETDVDEPMVLLSTSGTTGNVKIVQLSQRNVAASTFSYIDRMDFESRPGEERRFVSGVPFASAYGLLVVTAWVHQAVPLVMLEEPFTVDMFYRTAARHRTTHFEGGAAAALLMEQAIGRPNPYDVSSFRYFGFAGSKVAASTLRRLAQAFPGVEFWPGYGMAEAAPLIAKPVKHVNMEKLDSVGLPIDCISLMIEENGELTSAPRATGEILVKGPNVMLGYYRNEEATSQALKGGYLHTGDIGYLDEDGYLYLCGRKKNVIIVRGFNVHPEEVEACIISSGLARDCVVYGEEDPLGNERVCADIIPMNEQTQTDAIRLYCGERLAGYKQPQKLRMVEAIGKTATGKTERARK